VGLASEQPSMIFARPGSHRALFQPA
jgi:hypothetical protein